MLLGVKEEVIGSYNFDKLINVNDLVVDFEMPGEVLNLDLCMIKNVFDLHTWEYIQQKGNFNISLNNIAKNVAIEKR